MKRNKNKKKKKRRRRKRSIWSRKETPQVCSHNWATLLLTFGRNAHCSHCTMPTTSEEPKGVNKQEEFAREKMVTNQHRKMLACVKQKNTRMLSLKNRTSISRYSKYSFPFVATLLLIALAQVSLSFSQQEGDLAKLKSSSPSSNHLPSQMSELTISSSGGASPPRRALKRRQNHPNGSSHRESRVYRIRALGSNGSFNLSTITSSPPLSLHEEVPANNSHLADEMIEDNNEQQQQQFGARQTAAAGVSTTSGSQMKQNQMLAKLQTAPAPASNKSSRAQHQQQLVACQQQASDAAETSAEASSVSASSQTLRLSSATRVAPAEVALIASPVARDQLDDDKLSQQLANNNKQQQVLLSSNSRQASILHLIDEFDSKIATNKTKAHLSCDSGEMIVRLNFSNPFKGIVYPDHNRLSPCRFFGDGHHNYELRLPLRGCGTKQVAQRVFVNDVVVRFHKTLELEEDEVKTLICRYPPPLDTGAMTSLVTSAGNGNLLLHELESMASAGNRTSSAYDDEQTLVGGGVRATNRLGTTTTSKSSSHNAVDDVGERETGPETVLVAPLGGTQAHNNRNQQQEQGDASIKGGGVGRHRENLILAPPHTTQANRGQLRPLLANNQNNPNNENMLATVEPIVEPLDNESNSLQNQLLARQQQRPNFVDRLTSVELLFLISSLMFLALLSLGLIGGYFCFRRQHSAAASSILRSNARKRRYFNPQQVPLAGAQQQRVAAGTLTSSGGGGALVGRRLERAHYQTTGAAAALNVPHAPGQSYYYAPAYLSSSAGRVGVPSPASSSPNASDTSGRVLLPAPPLPPAPSQQASGSTFATGGRAHTSHRPYLGQQPSLSLRTPVAGRRELNGAEDKSPLSSGVDLYATGSRTGGRQASQWARGGIQPTHNGRRSAAASGQRGRATCDFFGSATQLNVATPTTNNWRQLQRHNELVATLGKSRASAREPLLKLGSGGEFVQNQFVESAVRQRGGGGARTKALADERISRARQLHSYAHESPSSPSSSDDTNNNNNNLTYDSDQQQEHTQRPRLLLKSIEDKFITNVTEIHEQEFVQHNKTRPLSLAEWRSAAAARQQARQQQNSQLNAADKAVATTATTTSGEHEEQEHEYHMNSATNCLRSLTELDVNFAKSLLRASSLSSGEEKQRELQDNKSNKKQQVNDAMRLDDKTNNQESDDDGLVISPEYKDDNDNEDAVATNQVQQVTGTGSRRFKFLYSTSGGGGATTKTTSSPTPSRESISYV